MFDCAHWFEVVWPAGQDFGSFHRESEGITARLIPHVKKTWEAAQGAEVYFLRARATSGFQLAARANYELSRDRRLSESPPAITWHLPCHFTGTNFCTRSPPNTSPV